MLKNSALPSSQINNISKYIKIETVILNCNNISQYYCFYCILVQIIVFLNGSENIKYLAYV